MLLSLLQWASVALSSISASGIAEEAIAGLIASSGFALLMWNDGRKKVANRLFLARCKVSSGWRRAKSAHSFVKLIVLWWMSITTVGAVDTFINPVPEAAYTACSVWAMSMFFVPGGICLHRRFWKAKASG